MNDINQDWKPTFGVMYYWLAMDSNGRIARMMNNSWGGCGYKKQLLPQFP